jgi:phosphomannomutase
MAGIFKAYDIRGVYGEDLTEETALRIGRAFVTLLGCRDVVVGRDMRPHSEPLFRALARGMTMQGADVVDLGMVSTPMCYHANGRLGAEAGIMLTASHNPGEWNGFKLCRELAIPISGDTGIRDLERIVQDGDFAPEAATPGAVTPYDIAADYMAHIRTFADLRRPLRIAVDFANAMGIAENRVLDGLIDIDPLFDTFDGTFPNHEANPLKAETYAALQKRVRGGTYDFGIAYDGDADRVGFVDEQGHIVPMDLVTALIAARMLEKEPGGSVFYDLRSSQAVKEVIEEHGGRALMSRVGHAFIKRQMRDEKAVFAGELSGHYYFRENYFTESAALAVLCVANLVSEGDAPLSAWVKPLQRYATSGEINSTVTNPQSAFQRLRDQFGHGHLLELDGLTFEFDDWWFNVRMSNTEPLVRLNLEANSPAAMAAHRDAVLAVIREGGRVNGER